jgi:tetratricopeptide (TPR) repeat protein
MILVGLSTTASAQVYRFQGRLTPQQVKEEEDLLARLAVARDTLRIEILDSLAWLYRGTDFERAMRYVQQGATEVERLGFPRVRAENQNYMGIVYRNLGSYPRAMQCFVEARRIAEKYGYLREEGYALNNIGDIYRYEGKYNEAIQFVMKSLQYFRTLSDTSGL